MSQNTETSQEELELQEMRERIWPKIWDDSIVGCYEAMMLTVKSMEDTVSVLDKCDKTLIENGYPFEEKYTSYKKWGLTIMESLLKKSRIEKDIAV